MPAAAVNTFSAVRGHARVVEFLQAAARSGRLAHALLFAGPDGIGKRAVAMAFAAWLHCETRRSQAVAGQGEHAVPPTPAQDDACGACAACHQIAAGSHPDVQVVGVPAGKKEIGVDRIRQLKRFMHLRPVQGASKLAIVDDAPLLTVAAQNALLKTLEEPPQHSVLILVAGNPDALLPTVRSRCQRVRFAPLPLEEVAAIVARSAGVEAGVAREMAVLAEGSPGRALSVGRALAGTARAELVTALAALGTARYVRVAHMAHELNQPESDAAVKLEAVLAHYRDEAVRAVGASQLAVHPASGTVAALPVSAALRRADAVYQAWIAIRRGNPNRQLLLEALLLRLSRV